MATRVRRRTNTATVSARTMAKRNARHVAAQQQGPERQEAESLAQCRVWDRKKKRYLLAGLCDPCAGQAAWGHQVGFGKISNPCRECQPLVDHFDTPGPEGSKWRKCLIKLEYLSDTELRDALVPVA